MELQVHQTLDASFFQPPQPTTFAPKFMGKYSQQKDRIKSLMEPKTVQYVMSPPKGVQNAMSPPKMVQTAMSPPKMAQSEMLPPMVGQTETQPTGSQQQSFYTAPKVLLLKPVSMPKPSQGIIFFKQQYNKLFQTTTDKLRSMEKVEIRFYNKSEGPTNQKNYVLVTIQANPRNPCSKCNEKGKSVIILKRIIGGQQKAKVQKKLEYKILPNSTSDTNRAAKKMFQKKFWVRLSADLNQVSLHLNDLAQTTALDSIKLPLGVQDEHSNWKTQQTIFKFQVSQNKTPFPLANLDTFNISIEFSNFNQPLLNDTLRQEILYKYLKIKVLGIKKILTPILQNRPSILGKNANKYLLTQQIRVLHQYLQGLSIYSLPKIYQKDKNFDENTYTNWKCLRAAIDNSIKTQPAYFCYRKRNYEQVRQPIGILNALMQLKTLDLHDPKSEDIFKWTEFKWKHPTYQQNLQQIYRKRHCYIRFEIGQQEGTSPGAMAVLQIWPPYSCSSIHNHGQAYGLIKVLANQICVQNFRDLNFIEQDHKPYQQNVYQEDQYTWITQFSFSIHRLINRTPCTSISLQAYMGDHGSKQYFQFILNQHLEEKQRKYIQYYPQNDWKNFLGFPEFLQGQNQAFKQKINKVKEVDGLVKFIKKIRQYYNIDSPKKYDFPHFAMVMKQQYEIFAKLSKLREQFYQSNVSNFKTSIQPVEK